MTTNQRFGWDEEKEKINIQKHKLDFATATRVFLDPYRIEKYDAAHSEIEDRYITIGLVGEIAIVIMVVYTERRSCTRIISARAATQKEKEEYFNGYDL